MVQSQEKLPHTSQNDTKLIKNCGNPKFLKIIKLILVYQNIEKWPNIARTKLTKSTKMNSENY